MKEARNTRETIEQEYSEFPETILRAELCRAYAHIGGRSIKQSLKAFALAHIGKIENKPLEGALGQMASSASPGTRVARVRSCVGRM